MKAQVPSFVRPCQPLDFEAMDAIVNDAAQAYRGVIPTDRWHDPYMPREELAHEIEQARKAILDLAAWWLRAGWRFAGGGEVHSPVSPPFSPTSIRQCGSLLGGRDRHLRGARLGLELPRLSRMERLER
jgi:hypothetical protein